MINALFVETNGTYSDDRRIIPWDINRNAFRCRNTLPAICHPPCKRWGRYWSGGPSAKIKRVLGDDNGAFAFCLWYVRTYGGIIEHPEASHAWKYYGLTKPPKSGGWIMADDYGGLTCCVEQGHYGHRARKATWLYLNGFNPIPLKWGKAEGKMRLEDGFRNKKHRNSSKLHKRIKASERLGTPEEFKDLLVNVLTTKK